MSPACCNITRSLLQILWYAAYAQSKSLWSAISENGSFSILSNCVRQADPALFALINGTAPSTACYTLFAPLDSAFSDAVNAATCPKGDHESATAIISYLLSNQTSPVPYLNQPFALPFVQEKNRKVNDAALYVYSINKDAVTRESLAPILYVNNAEAKSWEDLPASPGGSHYLVTLARYLEPPPGKGSLWDVLQAHENFSTTATLIGTKLPEFQRALEASPDVAGHTGYHTIFVPTDAAWAKVSADRLARLQGDPQALQTLLSYHTLSGNQPGGDYPRSTTGMYYSQQFYPTPGLQARDIYEAFYSSLSSFTGLRLSNDLGILLDISRLNGTLYLEGGRGAVVIPNLSAFNGVAHGLESVLPLPEALPDVVASPPPVLAAAGNFSILSQLLYTASISEAPELATGGPFTFLAPTDAAFAAAFASGQLPSLAVLLGDSALVASLCRYWAVDSSVHLYLFSPDPYADPFKDDFADGTSLLDGQKRTLWVHRLVSSDSTSLGGKINDTSVFINNARVYQCVEGKGWGHDCGAQPTPSNTYSINDGHLVNIVHALDAVPLPPKAGTLFQTLLQDPDVSSFVDLLQACPSGIDLVSKLNATTHTSPSSSSSSSTLTGRVDESQKLFTLWVPSNQAIAELNETRPWLLDSSEAIDEVVRYHIVPQLWYARWTHPSRALPTLAFDGEAQILTNATTWNSPSAAFINSHDRLYVNRIRVTDTDIAASNGVVHKISGVLIPDLMQVAYASGGLQRMVEALESKEGAYNGTILAQVLTGPGPFTLFAPRDNVLDLGDTVLASSQLQYHVGLSVVLVENITKYFQNAKRTTRETTTISSLSGLPLYVANLKATISNPYAGSKSGFYVNQAEMLLPVHRAVNGILYAVDAVLSPPDETIMDLLRRLDDGRAFADMLTQTGLHKELESSESWTIFAPTTSTLKNLYQKQQIWGDPCQASQILAFHLVKGRRLFTPSFANVSTCTLSTEGFCLGPSDVMSLQGQPLATQVVSKSQLFLSTIHGAFTAPVVYPDVHASNGVVHFVNGILTYSGYKRPSHPQQGGQRNI